MADRSRYASEGTPPDYSHRLHAGNVGDVWKHVVLVEVLAQVAATGARAAYVETHAGEGRYPLAATGEWTLGIGRLWTAAAPALERYLAICRAHGRGDARPTNHPGSPLLARTILGPDAPLALWERDAKAAARLASVLDDGHTRITTADGLAALDDALGAASSRARTVVAFVDPPWSRKGDWHDVPETVAAAARRHPRACLLLWYPLKSLTRPNAMMDRLAAGGVTGVAAELVTTPLEHQRRRLNGSGMLLIHAPADVAARVAAAAPAVAAHCATFPGVWSLRLRAFGPTAA
ncbi:MAG: 23S rRNA (adenine(2030)-N(6))-methyltransferase RlmJ [bacterium]|nr:23S rRNA (adenine(2030)-N(6))-methyltransferase RlmJ [bacterium]